MPGVGVVVVVAAGWDIVDDSETDIAAVAEDWNTAADSDTGNVGHRSIPGLRMSMAVEERSSSPSSMSMGKGNCGCVD